MANWFTLQYYPITDTLNYMPVVGKVVHYTLKKQWSRGQIVWTTKVSHEQLKIWVKNNIAYLMSWIAYSIYFIGYHQETYICKVHLCNLICINSVILYSTIIYWKFHWWSRINTDTNGLSSLITSCSYETILKKKK